MDIKTKSIGDRQIVIEKNNLLTLDGLVDILYSLNIKINNRSTLNSIYDIFNTRKLSYAQAWDIVSGASKLEVLIKKDNKKVTVDLENFFSKICSEYNIKLYTLMGRIDLKFKEYLNNELFEMRKNGVLTSDEFRLEKSKTFASVDKLIKDTWKKIKNVTQEFDERLGLVSGEELEDLYAYARIYDAIVQYTPTNKWVGYDGKEYLRVADDIFSNGYLKLKKSAKLKEVAENVKKLLKAMSSIDERFGEKEAFSKTEIANFLLNTPSLMNIINTQKFKAVQECLVAYVEELIERSNKAGLENGIKDLTAKDIIERCGSILTVSGNTLGQATNFLLGKTVEEIYREQLADKKFRFTDRNKNAVEHFPKLQIENMTISDHNRIATKQASVLMGVNFSSLYNTMEKCLNIFIATKYPDKDVSKIKIEEKKRLVEEMGIDYNHLITGKNLAVLFRSDVKDQLDDDKFGDIVHNINLLEKYINQNTIINIWKSNINVLFQPQGLLDEKIANILEKYPDPNSKEFKEELVVLINLTYSASIVVPNRVQTGRGHSRDLGDRDNVNEWVDVGFINDTPDDEKPLELTDKERYQMVHNEISGLNKMCQFFEDKITDEVHGDLISGWKNLGDMLKAKTEKSDSDIRGSVVDNLRKPVLLYSSNKTPEVSLISALKKVGDLAEGIESDETKKCLRSELDVLVGRIEDLIEDKLTLLINSVERKSNIFYEEDRRHTRTPSAKKYSEAKEKINAKLNELMSTLAPSLISKMTGIEALKRDSMHFDAMEEEITSASKMYKQKRKEASNLEAMRAELHELISMFGVVKNYLNKVSNSMPEHTHSSVQKVFVQDIVVKDKSEKDILIERLAELKKIVGDKVYKMTKANYKGKDFKRLYHNMGLKVGDEMYNYIAEIADILKKLDKIEQAKSCTVTNLE